MYQTCEINEAGTFKMKFKAEGILSATPINPLTGEAIGEPLEAVVKETHTSFMNDKDFSASNMLFQKLLPTADPSSGWLFERMTIDSKGHFGFEEKTTCSEKSDLFTSN